MMEAFRSGGTMMWPLTLIGLGILWLTIRTALRMRRPDHESGQSASSLQAILFWGAMSLVLGMLGTAMGWISATRAIGAAGEADPVLIWEGIGLTLYTLTFGMLIFTFATFCWFVLRQMPQRT